MLINIYADKVIKHIDVETYLYSRQYMICKNRSDIC